MTGRIGVRLEILTDGVRQALEEYISALADFELRSEENAGLSQLLVLELDAGDPDETFARIRAVQHSLPSTEIFLTSVRMDPQLLLEVLRAGVKEFLTQPLRPDEVQQAFWRFRERHAESAALETRRSGKILAFIGGKGGVGTTTIACGLAAALKANGAAVVVVDLNLRGGDVPAAFDMNPIRSLRDVDLDLSRLDQAFLSDMLAQHSSGVEILPLGDSDLSGAHVSSDSVDRTLKMLRTMFDFVIVDCGHNLQLTEYAALGLAAQVYLVTVLTVPVVRRTKRMLDTLRGADGVGLDPSVISLLVNRYADRDEPILTEVRNVLGKAKWQLPHDFEAAADALNGGQTVVSHAPKSKLSRAIRKIADELHAPGSHGSRSSFFSGMLRSFSGRMKPTNNPG